MDCDADTFDVLEFGEALMAARPHLRAKAAPLTESSDAADRLVERALKLAWRERRSFRAADEIGAWLSHALHSQATH
jgi:DNA-directed RNA polymerase specialized sigma24 family protein